MNFDFEKSKKKIKKSKKKLETNLKNLFFRFKTNFERKTDLDRKDKVVAVVRPNLQLAVDAVVVVVADDVVDVVDDYVKQANENLNDCFALKAIDLICN